MKNKSLAVVTHRAGRASCPAWDELQLEPCNPRLDASLRACGYWNPRGVAAHDLLDLKRCLASLVDLGPYRKIETHPSGPSELEVPTSGDSRCTREALCNVA